MTIPDVIYIRKILSTDSRLKRHVRHDSRSWDYRLDTSGLKVGSVKWERQAPVFDQGDLGSCVGNAAVGCMGTLPYSGTVTSPKFTEDEKGAVALYSAATKLDDDPQNYPPTDTGSDGLSAAKALQAAGEISGYQHTFTLEDALKALQVGPLITGINWYNSMFTPSSTGLVKLTKSSGVAGGHEIVVDEYQADTDRVGFQNSWGTSWGVGGRFYMKSADWGSLLAEQGDVILFTPATQPAPTPFPAPAPPVADRDVTLWATAGPWVASTHIGSNKKMADALKAWHTS